MTEDLLQWGTDKLKKAYSHRCYDIQHCPPCHCRQRSNLFFSFQLRGNDERRYTNQDGELMEDCGYYCASCGFANAGGRTVKELGG